MASRVRGVDVKVKLVADMRRGVDAEQRAREVARPSTDGPRSRVEVKLDVETYEGGGRADRDTVAKTPSSHGGPVAAGGGVLGFLLSDKTAAAAGPELPSLAADSPAGLARFTGFDVTLTVFDPEEHDSLAAANRRGDSIDVSGALLSASDEAVVIEKPGGERAEIDLSLWTLAEAEVSRSAWSFRDDDTSGTLAGLDAALMPGAPVEVRVLGRREPLRATFVGTGRDDRGGLVVDVVDDAGRTARLAGSDVYDVATPGFRFPAFRRD